MTNVPGIGFLLILSGGLVMILLFVAGLFSLGIRLWKPNIRFHYLLAGSYLGIGIVSAVILIVDAWPDVSFLRDQLLLGTLVYLVGGVLFLGITLGLSILAIRVVSEQNYEAALYYATLSWVGGFGLPIVVGLASNFLIMLAAPLTGFLSSLFVGPLLAYYRGETPVTDR